MKKAFLLEFIFLAFSFVISFVLNDWDLMYKILGTIGIASLLFSGLFLGVFISGDQLRVNYHTENKKDREKQTKYTYTLIRFSLPNLIGAIIVFILI